MNILSVINKTGVNQFTLSVLEIYVSYMVGFNLFVIFLMLDNISVISFIYWRSLLLFNIDIKLTFFHFHLRSSSSLDAILSINPWLDVR